MSAPPPRRTTTHARARRLAASLALLLALTAPAGGQEAGPLDPERLLRRRDAGPDPIQSGNAPPGTGGAPRIQRARPDAPLQDDLRLGGVYRTPRAGEGFRTVLFGAPVTVLGRDRGDILAVTLGGAAWHPKLGDTAAIPIGAFFGRQIWIDPGSGQTDRFVRFSFAALVNELDYAERVGPVYPTFHLETDYRRLLFGQEEYLADEQVEATSLEWGYGAGWLGLGWRRRVWPAHIDNEVILEAFYQAGYLYAERTDDTDPLLDVPGDTFFHGLRLRARLDMLERNLLELPHYGLAVGGDVELTRRDRWTSEGALSGLAPEPTPHSDTRDYLKLAGHLVLAGPVPLLTERHRLLLHAHGGWSPTGDLDRFSAFRIGGGPIPTESGDLWRVVFPGALFGQLAARRYAIATITYRYELFFFLFLHLRASLMYVEAPSLDERTGAIDFESELTDSYSVALTSGFLWSSQLHIAYTWGGGEVRGDEDAHSLLLIWSKSF